MVHHRQGESSLPGPLTCRRVGRQNEMGPRQECSLQDERKTPLCVSPVHQCSPSSRDPPSPRRPTLVSNSIITRRLAITPRPTLHSILSPPCHHFVHCITPFPLLPTHLHYWWRVTRAPRAQPRWAHPRTDLFHRVLVRSSPSSLPPQPAHPSSRVHTREHRRSPPRP